MSATNRGTKRRPHDFYPTPIPTIEAFLDIFPLRGGIEVLEPGAGGGNIIKTLQKYGDFTIDAVEIRPEEKENLQQLGANVIIGDYLSMNIDKKYDLIIGNPPFGQAIAGLYTLHKRPSFTGHGTDATSYSWFVWQPDSNRQTIKII